MYEIAPWKQVQNSKGTYLCGMGIHKNRFYCHIIRDIR